MGKGTFFLFLFLTDGCRRLNRTVALKSGYDSGPLKRLNICFLGTIASLDSMNTGLNGARGLVILKKLDYNGFSEGRLNGVDKGGGCVKFWLSGAIGFFF